MKKLSTALGVYTMPRLTELKVSLERGFQISTPTGADDWTEGNGDFMN